MMNKDEQMEEHEISFCNFILEEDNKELKKNNVKRKYNFGLVSLYRQNKHTQ